MDQLPFFKNIEVVDTEFRRLPGGLPDPVCCVVSHELRSGRTVERWTADGGGSVPYDVGPSTLCVAHYSIAEWVAHLALGGPLPVHVIDTYAEARALRNGLSDGKSGLLAAAERYGIGTIAPAEKDAGRELAKRGGPWSAEEQTQLLNYCASDVRTNAELFRRMLPDILKPELGLQHALLRGRYMVACARVEHCGVPFDHDLLIRLQAKWTTLQLRLIEAVDAGHYDCYDGTTFKQDRFKRLLDRLGLLEHWPRTMTGLLSTAEKEFKPKADAHPELRQLYELVQTLRSLKTLSLGVGKDGRHRADMLGAFGTNTGRNAPKAFVFAPTRWVRHLIKPERGLAVIYSDYSGQELHVAARLSGDPKLIEAVESGDPYMLFARETGLAPPDATKATHSYLRDKIKPFMLGVNYGMSAFGVAEKVGTTYEDALYNLLTKHKILFPVYWKWSLTNLYASAESGRAITRFGWPMHVNSQTKMRSLLNHPIQASGAYILRFACIGLTEIGVHVAAPVHDAVLTVCTLDEVDEHVATVQRVMRLAAKVGIGAEIPVESTVTRWPDRYHEPRGAEMFGKVMGLLLEMEAADQPDIPPKVAQPATLYQMSSSICGYPYCSPIKNKKERRELDISINARAPDILAVGSAS